MASERTFHFTSIFSQPVGREGKEREKGKPNLRGRVRERERERLYLLSRFSDDRIIVFRQSKRKSSSLRQGLCIETGVGKFRQTPRGRGFLLLGLILI